MWCANCQADVAAEVSQDNRRVMCATCGVELTSQPEQPDQDRITEARQLLERWAKDNLLEPQQPEQPKKTSNFRFDSPHEHLAGSRQPRENSGNPPPVTPDGSEDSRPAPPIKQPISNLSGPHRPRAQAPTPPSPPAQPPTTATPQPPRERQFHAAHPSPPAAPHFDVDATLFGQTKKKTNFVSLVGQVLAYGGVALLTVGTAMILGGYFGGPEKYTPTGWLVATVGQMLLFLGVVTLVSSGIEQTSDEVTKRVEILGKHILRIEQTSHAMKGPHIPAQAFTEGGSAPVSKHQHQTGQNPQNPPAAG